MSPPRNMILTLLSGGMILTVHDAWVGLLFPCLGQEPISVPSAGAILLAATATTWSHHRRGWRRFYYVAVHATALLFVVAQVCQGYHGLRAPFWSFYWIQRLYEFPQTEASWFLVPLIIMSVSLLWFCGSRLITRPTSQLTINRRFDVGLGLLLLLLLVKLTAVGKGVALPAEHSAVRAIVAYIALGLFSLSAVRHDSRFKVVGITRFSGAGTSLLFAFLILVLGNGLILFFLPELQALASSSTGLLGEFATAVVSAVRATLRFIANAVAWAPPVGGGRPTGASGVPHILGSGVPLNFVSVFMLFLVAVVLFVGLSFLLHQLIGWLRSRSQKDKEAKGLWAHVLVLIEAVALVLLSIWHSWRRGRDDSQLAQGIYRRLVSWGRSSGIGHAASETPKELGSRLACRFPQLAVEIGLIIDMHDDVVYGCISPHKAQLSRAKRALKELHHPKLWIARLKSMSVVDRP